MARLTIRPPSSTSAAGKAFYPLADPLLTPKGLRLDRSTFDDEWLTVYQAHGLSHQFISQMRP